MATVTFDHATRIYPGNDRPSVDQLNLEIADGEFLVLVGPSGCGKSTTLRMLAGLEPVDEGRILIDGKDVTIRDGFRAYRSLDDGAVTAVSHRRRSLLAAGVVSAS